LHCSCSDPYFAKRGSIALSARQKGNAMMELGYSLAFWGALVFTVFLFVLGLSEN
jgi:hypothetical protein